MTITEIVERLAKCDPVYGPVRGPKPVDKDGWPVEGAKYTSVRICALCGATSGDQQENVRHESTCPWIPAREAIAKAQS